MSLLTSYWPWGSLDHKDTILQLPDGKVAHMVREGDLIRSQVLDSTETGDRSSEEITILSGAEEIFYIPVLPERSVVLRSEHVLRIVPGNQFSTIVQIPLVPTISRKDRKGRYQPLVCMPISSLSKTWFGDPVEGEPAFAISSLLDEAGKIHDFGPWVASCPLVIINSSPEILSFERLILRVPLLSLYSGNNRYYTNQLTVRFRGQDQTSQVQIGTSAPGVDDELTLFSGPANKGDSRLLKKSFSFIKSLAYG